MAAAPFVCPLVNTPNHVEHRSLCAFLSYFVYSAEEGGAYNGQPVLLARKCNHALHKLPFHTVVRVEDIANWALYRTNDTLYLAFRGTDDLQDVVTDVSVAPIRHVIGNNMYSLHSGFLTVTHSYDTIVQYVTHFSRLHNCHQLVITGHSLGGAHAQVFGLKYDHDAALVQCPALHSIITFAAPQSCINPPPPSLWQNRCINYIMMNDPFPYLPSFAIHRFAVLFNTKLATNNSYVARFVATMVDLTGIKVRGLNYLSRYHSLVNAILIRPTNHELAHFTPASHHRHVHDMEWEEVAKLNTSSHKMLFYLGELRTLNLLNDAVKNWNNNATPQRYSDTFRSMISVYMLWTEQIYAIVNPMYVYVFQNSMSDNVRRLFVRHTWLLGEGSTYLFIDPSTTAEQLDELKRQYIDMRNDGVSVELYKRGDYSWIRRVSDIRLLLETVHPLAFWERNSGALDHYEKRNLNMKDESGMNGYEAAQLIMAEKSNDSPEYIFAEMLLNSRQSMELDLRSSAQSIREPNIHVSICALLNLRATMSLHRTFEWNQHIVHLDCCGKGWAVYMCNGSVYIVFHNMRRNGQYYFDDIEWIVGCIPSHILQDESLSIIATGHYIGGSWAQTFAMLLKRPSARAITFGAPPLHLQTIEESSEYEKNIINYVHEDDIMPRLNQENITGSEDFSEYLVIDEDECNMLRGFKRKINRRDTDRKSLIYHVGTQVDLPGTTLRTDDSTEKKVYSFQSMESYCNALSLKDEVHKAISGQYHEELFSAIRDSPISKRSTPLPDDDMIDHTSVCALLALRMEQRVPHEQNDLKDPVRLLCCSKHCAMYTYHDTLYIVLPSFPSSSCYSLNYIMAMRLVHQLLYMELDMLMRDASIPVIVTGHYVGGTLAQTFAMLLKRPNARAITFGAPPLHIQTIEEPSEFEKNIINYVRRDDPVPHLNQENVTVSDDYSAIMFFDKDDLYTLRHFIKMINRMDNEIKSLLRNVGTLVGISGATPLLIKDSAGKKNYSLQSMESYSDALSLNERVTALKKRDSSMERKMAV